MSTMKKVITKFVKEYLYRFANMDDEVRIKYIFSRVYKESINKKIDEYNVNLKFIEKEQKKYPIVIVFICQMPSLWNNVASIFEEALNDNRVAPYIVAIPEKIIGDNYEVTEEKYGRNDAYEFCVKLYGKCVINGYNSETKGFFDLRILKPAYICLPRPYDEQVPPEYQSSELCKYSKLFFVPYGYNLCKWDVKLLYDLNFQSSVYAIFAENEYSKKMAYNSFKFFKAEKNRHIFNVGYPGFDYYIEKKHTYDSNYSYTVLWMPRWTTNNKIEPTSFFKFKDQLIKYFIAHKDIKFIFRPHPLMFRNFISCGLMSKQEVELFLKNFDQYSNFVYDKNGDYSKTLLSANIIISDYSSLLIHSLLMEVPVLYTGNVSNFNRFVKKTVKGLYLVSNEKKLFSLLDQLICGKDTLMNKRNEVRNLLTNNYSYAGKKILQLLIEDYEKYW